MEPDYIGKIADYNQRNATEVADTIPDEKLDRLAARCREFGISNQTFNEVKALLLADTPAARALRVLHYAKSAKRQNPYEPAFLEFAAQVASGYAVTSLPASGTRAFYPHAGVIMPARQRPKASRAKSFDFSVEGDTGRLLIAHKYTEDEGGAQDNQYHDLLQIADQCRGLHGDTAVILIADGPYYTRNHSRENPVPRLEVLSKTIAGETHVASGTGRDFPSLFHRFQRLLDEGGA